MKPAASSSTTAGCASSARAAPAAPAPYYLIADDAAGGYFALNGGGLDGTPGNVCYFAPDTLEWEDCELGYTDFLNWAFNGNLALFYENVRWPGWQQDAAALDGNSVYSFFPPLWSAEGANASQTTHRAVPIAEHYAATLGSQASV